MLKELGFSSCEKARSTLITALKCFYRYDKVFEVVLENIADGNGRRCMRGFRLDIRKRTLVGGSCSTGTGHPERW